MTSSIHMLESIICMGQVSVSPKLMDLCAQRGVTIAYFDPYGRFLARVEGPVSGNILLRKEQYRVSDDPTHSLQFAKAFIGAKIRNARSVLQRHLRNYPDCEEHESLDFAVRRLAVLLEKAGSAENVDSLRGLEGQAADEYFARFNFLIKSKMMPNSTKLLEISMSHHSDMAFMVQMTVESCAVNLAD